MTEITLYNTATRAKERFEPLDDKNVRMYVCGPTVYDRAHIGNARPVIVFDTLFRLLRHVYGEKHVTYVRNFTDVDDKINATALARKEAGSDGSLEALIAERTDETIGWYHADMEALGTLRPTFEPRATAHIGDMIAMIEGLIAKGHAYAAEGHVLFRVRSYAEYGALSGRSVDDMIAGARVEVAPYKEDPMDFVLWKPSSDDLPGWPSPWGRGRPGWHIECSAMAYELLGDRFDIHGGGNDLQFPHHENEIAQSKCSGHGFANVWMHNEMLQVEGKKMSKSLGNFFTVRDLLDQGVPGEVIRFVFLSTHYRKPMDWTEAKRAEAEGTLEKWYDSAALGVDGHWDVEAVVEKLSNDLDAPGAIGLLHEFCNKDQDDELRLGMRLLGFPFPNGEVPPRYKVNRWMADDLSDVVAVQWRGAIEREVEECLRSIARRTYETRITAMSEKDFSAMDALRTELVAAGLDVHMSKVGVELHVTPDFDSAKLEALK